MWEVFISASLKRKLRLQPSGSRRPDVHLYDVFEPFDQHKNEKIMKNNLVQYRRVRIVVTTAIVYV